MFHVGGMYLWLLFALGQPVVHQYKIVTQDGGTSVMAGTSIRSNGFCVDIMLNGRVDTIVCNPKYITELPPEEPKVPVREEPTGVQPPNAALEG